MKNSGRIRAAHKKKGVWLYLCVLAVSFSLSAGVSYFYLKGKFAFESSFLADIEARHAKKDADKYNEESLRLYKEKELAQEAKGGALFRKDKSLIEAEDIIRKHMKPYGVRLLDLYMDKEGNIYIDLGDELIKNYKGDVAEELNIVAGLYKGLKSIIPELTYLRILIEGKETESFGGHIDISRPIGEEIIESI